MTEPIPDPEVESFLAVSAARLAPRTVEAYRRDLTALAAWLRHSPATATREELERYLAELRAEGLAASTIARRLAAARAFFRHRVLIGAAAENPAADVALSQTRPPPAAHALTGRGRAPGRGSLGHEAA